MPRRVVRVTGIVQGVGFRPFVHRLAVRLRLGGSVSNQAANVIIVIEGTQESLEEFLRQLHDHPPSAARIVSIEWESEPERGETSFLIEVSQSSFGDVYIGPDLGVCDDCLRELNDPLDRRYGYPFLNCTNCGPRLTIIQSVPYDRERTTMAKFVMCDDCLAEYHDPGDRRFHAQPTACPKCGPQLKYIGEGTAIEALMAGRILAVKGLGGYHLVCDATNDSAVRKLRERKHRDEKPFAVVVHNLVQVHEFAEVSEVEAKELRSSSRPIVLLKRKPGVLAESVAPGGNPRIGIMLPSTPLHHLLTQSLSPLVMTSGNRSDEPSAFRDDDALSRLADIADGFLIHDRPIHRPTETSNSTIPRRRPRTDSIAVRVS